MYQILRLTTCHKLQVVLLIKCSFLKILLISLISAGFSELKAQNSKLDESQKVPKISMAPFADGTNHWYGIRDKSNIINPKKNQPRYAEKEIINIADNILLYQRNNGGWPKNYDMQAILLPDQIDSLLQTKNQHNTTFDNSTTYTHIDYLAQVYTITSIEKYKDACLKGLNFVFSAQYPNGGWPQYFPLGKNYSRHITFNDGAFIGIMQLLKKITDNNACYSFIENDIRKKAKLAFNNGLDCILKMQILSNGKLTVWCQQHDEKSLKPAWARAFEPPAICNGESVDIVLLLMSIKNPDTRIIQSVQNAVNWFEKSKIENIRIETVTAPSEDSQFRTSTTDKVVVSDTTARPIWTRFYEPETERPLFCDRNSKYLYSLAEVSRERRDGYAWYTYSPQIILDKYPDWQKKYAPAIGQVIIPRDTSFTTFQAWQKIKKEFPQAKIIKPHLPTGVLSTPNLVYTRLSDTNYGLRDLHLDLFSPQKKGKHPAVLFIHGGGWRSGDKSMEIPLAQQIAAKGYVTAVVEYRLSPEAHYPAAVYDIKAAIRYLRENAKKFNIKSNKMAVSGTSAGGQLAALVGMTGNLNRFEGFNVENKISTEIQAIIDIDGILDFTDPNESAKDTDPLKPSAGTYWFGSTFKESPGKWIEASPIQYAGKNSPPILFINSALPRFHAGRDSVIFILNKYNIYTEVHTIPDTPHPFWLFHPWFDQTVNLMAVFLDKVLK